MKPESMTWNEYITQSARSQWKSHALYPAYLKSIETLQQVQDLYHSNLITKNCAKTIIKEKTQKVAIDKGYPEWSFRFQCLTTGRQSKFIKMEDYPSFGITKADRENGGTFSERLEIDDRISEAANAMKEHVHNILKKAGFTDIQSSWWNRYTEYLMSKEWSDKRELVKDRANNCCEFTKEKNTSLEIHHLSYENVGDEPIEDLVALKYSVHWAIHNDKDPDHRKYKMMETFWREKIQVSTSK
jgi:hypothetical protein